VCCAWVHCNAVVLAQESPRRLARGGKRMRAALRCEREREREENELSYRLRQR
jgi:hypothetical protein